MPTPTNAVDDEGKLVLIIPAEYSWLGVVGACVRAVLERKRGSGVDDNLIYNVELAVHETCTNIIEHAYAGEPGRIRIETKILDAPPQFIATLHDQGRPFEVPEINMPNPEKPQIKGYGLFLVNELMDKVTYSAEAEGNCWRLEKNLY